MNTEQAVDWCYDNYPNKVISPKYGLVMRAFLGYNPYNVFENDELSICYWMNHDLMNGNVRLLPAGDFAPHLDILDEVTDWEIYREEQ
jgi:hypothetical protein